MLSETADERLHCLLEEGAVLKDLLSRLGSERAAGDFAGVDGQTEAPIVRNDDRRASQELVHHRA
jgi:hypothetical protein